MNYRDEAMRLKRVIISMCSQCQGGSMRGVADCKNASCKLHGERMTPVQIELFDANYRELWIAATVAVIERNDWFFPAFWSCIREHAVISGVKGPGHPNWWGSVASRLLKTGRYEIDRNAGRTNPGHGSRENLWRRK